MKKEYLYWLTPYSGLWGSYHTAIWEMAGSFERAYYIEGMELKKLGILQSEENAARMTGGRNGFPAWSGSITVYRRRESVL